MSVVDVYNLEKKVVSEIELRDDVFDVPIKNHVLHQVVVSQLASKRSGTAATKTRSEVKSSGAKRWRQKGTGRARVGGGASPTRRGGGVAFGPSPRRYDLKVNKKVRKAAVRMALTDKAKEKQLIVIDNLELPEIKTKAFVEVLRDFEVEKALIVTLERLTTLEKSSRNVQGVKVMACDGLNAYDILKYRHLILEEPAVGKIQEALVS